MFKFKPNADVIGTSLRGYVSLKPNDVSRTFGKGTEDDSYKVSRSYSFLNEETDEVFTLYDWKSTSLYDGNSEDPNTFWKSNENYEFHIGGFPGTNWETFKEWVIQEVEKNNTKLDKHYDPEYIDLLLSDEEKHTIL